MTEVLLDWEFDAAMLALGSPDVEVSIKASLRLHAHNSALHEQLENIHDMLPRNHKHDASGLHVEG